MTVLLSSSHYFNRLERYINMKKSCSQLKDAARACLLGHYGILIGTMIIIEIAIIIFNMPFGSMMNQGILFMVPYRIILGYAGSIVVSLVAMVFSCGISYMHLNISRQKAVRFSDVLYCIKNRPDKYLGLGLIIIVISTLLMLPGTLCSIIGAFISQQESNIRTASILLFASFVLLIVGCIVLFIIMLSWSQAVYLLLDHPDLTVWGAIKRSTQAMKGNKWRLFVLYLSFIGWFFLGLISMGIAFLWIQHYLQQSMTQFYLDIMN